MKIFMTFKNDFCLDFLIFLQFSNSFFSHHNLSPSDAHSMKLFNCFFWQPQFSMQIEAFIVYARVKTNFYHNLVCLLSLIPMAGATSRGE